MSAGANDLQIRPATELMHLARPPLSVAMSGSSGSRAIIA
jgi:hypothetical protein